jgi:hypothetical protein
MNIPRVALTTFLHFFLLLSVGTIKMSAVTAAATQCPMATWRDGGRGTGEVASTDHRIDREWNNAGGIPASE